MPRIAAWRGVCVIAIFCAVAALLIWLSYRHSSFWLAAAVLVLPGVFGSVYFRCRRCPVCKRRLTMQRRPTADGLILTAPPAGGGPAPAKPMPRETDWSNREFRIWLDCDHCRIRWDTGQVECPSDCGDGGD